MSTLRGGIGVQLQLHQYDRPPSRLHALLVMGVNYFSWNPAPEVYMLSFRRPSVTPSVTLLPMR